MNIRSLIMSSRDSFWADPRLPLGINTTSLNKELYCGIIRFTRYSSASSLVVSLS